jgi:hypothetical protein
MRARVANVPMMVPDNLRGGQHRLLPIREMADTKVTRGRTENANEQVFGGRLLGSEDYSGSESSGTATTTSVTGIVDGVEVESRFGINNEGSVTRSGMGDR